MNASQFIGKNTGQDVIDITRYFRHDDIGVSRLLRYCRVRSGDPFGLAYSQYVTKSRNHLLAPITFRPYYKGVLRLVEEIFLNANQHGNQNDPTKFVEMALSETSNGYLIQVSDEGYISDENLREMLEKTMKRLKEIPDTVEDLRYETTEILKEYMVAERKSNTEMEAELSNVLDGIIKKSESEADRKMAPSVERIEELLRKLQGEVTEEAIEGGHHNFGKGSKMIHAAVFDRKDLGVSRITYESLNTYNHPYAEIFYDRTEDGTTRVNILLKKEKVLEKTAA